MDRDYEFVKNYYGENMAKFCRSHFSTILDNPGLLPKILDKTFARSRSLYSDVVKNDKTRAFFVNKILSSVDKKRNKPEIVEGGATPEQLMRRAGYILFPECETEDDIQRFKKYYQPNEALCTFDGGRLNTCRVWFAVRISELRDDDIQHFGIELTEEEEQFRKSKLKREDYRGIEMREDEYGTSVLSIQFTRNSPSELSIKNRYNHTVSNPDATFGNCLNRIIFGLENAFLSHYDIDMELEPFELNTLEGYSEDVFGKLYKTSLRLNNIRYCENNTILVSGKVHKFDGGRFVLVGSYLIDRKEKNITEIGANLVIEPNGKDHYELVTKKSRYPAFEDVTIIKNNKTGGKHIELTAKDGQKLVLDTDMANWAINLEDPFITEIEDGAYFDGFEKIKTYSAINLKYVESDDFLNQRQNLEKVNLPNLQRVNNSFLAGATKLKEVSLPSLTFAGNDFLAGSDVEDIDLPNLKRVHNSFLASTLKLKEVSLPSLTFAGTDCLAGSGVEDIYMPNLKEVQICFLHDTQKLKKVSLPSLTYAGDHCLSMSGVKQVDLPNLLKAGWLLLYSNADLEYVNVPNLNSAGYGFLLDSNVKVVNGKVKKQDQMWVVDNPNKQNNGDQYIICK